MTSSPRVRSYDIKRVMEVKRKIQADLEVQSCIGGPLSGSDLGEFATVICNTLPGDIRVEPIEDSVVCIAGERITEEVISDLAWRLAGNLHTLRQGRAVTPWTNQSAYEWVPMQCVESLPRRTRNHKLAAKVTFRVLAGSACPELITKHWTQRFMRYVSSNVGFSKPWGDYVFKDIHEFVGLRMYGLLSPDLSIGGPNFDKVKVTHSLHQYNRDIMRKRARKGGFECPAKYTHPCFNCSVGYDQCSVATHPRTYSRGLCQSCNKEAWMDPRCTQNGICVDCMNVKSLSKKD